MSKIVNEILISDIPEYMLEKVVDVMEVENKYYADSWYGMDTSMKIESLLDGIYSHLKIITERGNGIVQINRTMGNWVEKVDVMTVDELSKIIGVSYVPACLQ